MCEEQAEFSTLRQVPRYLLVYKGTYIPQLDPRTTSPRNTVDSQPPPAALLGQTPAECSRRGTSINIRCAARASAYKNHPIHARHTLALGPPVDRHRPVGAILPYTLALPIARPDIVQTPFPTRCIFGQAQPPTTRIEQRRRGSTSISKQPPARRIVTHKSTYHPTAAPLALICIYTTVALLSK